MVHFDDSDSDSGISDFQTSNIRILTTDSDYLELIDTIQHLQISNCDHYNNNSNINQAPKILTIIPLLFTVVCLTNAKYVVNFSYWLRRKIIFW
jgi:hypothetical protein